MHLRPLFALPLLLVCTAPVAQEQQDFTMEGELGIIVTTGNTETTSIKAKLSAHHELERFSNDYVIEGLYKEDEITNDEGEEVSETTAQQYFISGQANYKLDNPNKRIFGFLSYEDDRFSGFDYQSTVAAGYSEILWDDESSKFEYSVGPGYSYDKLNNGETVQGVILRAALDYRWNISETAVFRQLASTEIGSDNVKSKSETSVSARLYEDLSMKVALSLDHNSDVPAGRDNLDTQTSVTLVYTF